MIDGAVARVFFLIGRMQRLLKGVEYLVETFNLHIPGEVQKEKQQSRKYPHWLVSHSYPPIAQGRHLRSGAKVRDLQRYLQHYCI
jgi:hypothetical protein